MKSAAKISCSNQGSEACVHLCTPFAFYSGSTINIIVLNDSFNGKPSFTFNMNSPPSREKAPKALLERRPISVPQREGAQLRRLRVACEQRWPGLQLRVERKWREIGGLSTAGLPGSRLLSITRKVISHVDPCVECSFNLRYGPASGSPNIEEGSEGAETEAFIVLEEKEEPPHFSGISIVWVIHTKEGECPASPSQEW